MFAKLHDQFGNAGLGLSVVALVLALGGGAYAASHSATVSKAGPRGKTGKAGPQGPAGLAGPTGSAGTNGTNGSNGESVKVTALNDGECANGQAGARFTVGSQKAEACEGNPAKYPETLPPGKTETGTWSFAYEKGAHAFSDVVGSAVSFPIPLGSEPLPKEGIAEGQAQYNPNGQDVGGCAGSFEQPTAPAGALCVYEGPGGHLGKKTEPTGVQTGGGEEEAAQWGFYLHFKKLEELPEGPIQAHGTWAVTAPVEP